MSNTDRELLELAAKAAGYWDNGFNCWNGGEHLGWNPLESDKDALRLAVKLGISITPYPIYTQPKHSVLVDVKQRIVDHRSTPEKQLPMNAVRNEHMEVYNDDPYAATRRAIVRAAAEAGKGMKP